ncbi:hypothetical protein PPL_05548 [Heterostelium album PN500]|uniref:Uncharacterized protein n=1 Tax=Heterostelium pallidum (strain ATCC 26659 / Pp 5 / PN500) TaxID=670386 RepID=D3BAH2_HETP5|nr:hypothetical protein PPL_05548 [Heterostelium album PN500]EFA81559.1 hypothetical protein PPL_05548 [Heterostelium album PN500]|eukprot:XP_020433676.1 hypothetical protein PPL_05548 [Heterostelium album PN500]
MNELLKRLEENVSPIPFLKKDDTTNESTDSNRLSILNNNDLKSDLYDSFSLVGGIDYLADQFISQHQQDILNKTQENIDQSHEFNTKRQHLELNEDQQNNNNTTLEHDLTPDEVEYILNLNQMVSSFQTSMEKVVQEFRSEIEKGLDEYCKSNYEEIQITSDSLRQLIETMKQKLKQNNRIRDKILSFREEIKSLYQMVCNSQQQQQQHEEQQ